MYKSNTSRVHFLQELNAPLISRLALLSYDTSIFHKFLLYIIFLVGQIQLFAITLYIALLSLNQQDSSFTWTLKQVEYLFFLKDIANFYTYNLLSYGMLIFFLVYLLAMLALASYLLLAIKIVKLPIRIALKVWTMLRFMHPIILFYPIHIFCLQVLKNLSQGEHLFVTGSNRDMVVKVCSCFVIVINFVVTILIEFFLSINFSTNNVLGTKSRIINIFDLCFKASLPPLFIFIRHSKSSSIVFLIICLLCWSIRAGVIFYFLPYYKISLLKIATGAQAIAISLLSAAIIALIVIANRSTQLAVGLFLLLWALLGAFFLKLDANVLSNILFKIVSAPKNVTNIYHLIHYLKIVKHYADDAVIKMNEGKAPRGLMNYITLIKDSEMGHLILLEGGLVWSKEVKEKVSRGFQELFLQYLKQLASQNPDFMLLQGMLAYKYIKYNSISILANNIADRNIENSMFIHRNYFYFIKLLVLEKLKASQSLENQQEKTNPNTMSVREILESYRAYQHTKNNIKIQLDLQLKFWTDFQADKVQFLSLINLCKKIYKQSKIVQKNIERLPDYTKSGFLKPYLISSLYYCFLQNDIIKSYFYYLNFSKLVSKIKGKNLTIDSEALYFIISTTEKNKGIIIDHFGKLQQKFNILKQNMIGDSLTKIFPSMYAYKFENFLKKFWNSSNITAATESLELPVITKEGHLLPCTTKLNLIYLPVNGLCLYGLVAPVNDHNRHIIISGNGQILHWSENFQKDMRVDNVKEMKGKRIFEFCPDLWNILEKIKSAQEYFVLSSKGTKKDSFVPVPHQKKKVLEVSIDHDDQEDQNHKLPSMRHLSQESNLLFYSSKKEENITPKSSPNKPKYFTAFIANIALNGKPSSLYEIKMQKISSDIYHSAPSIPKHTEGAKIFTSIEEIEDWHTSTREHVKTEAMLTVNPTSDPFESYERFETKISATAPLIKLRRKTAESNRTHPDVLDEFQKTDRTNRYLINLISERGQLLEKKTEPEDKSPHNPHTPHSPQTPQSPRRLASMSFCGELPVLSTDPVNKIEEDDSGINKNLNKAEKNLFNEAFKESIITDTENTKSTHSRGYGRHKIARNILRSRRYKPMAIYYNFCFIIAFLILFGFLVWLNVQVSKTSKEVLVLSNVVQNAYFRNYWIKIAIRDMHYWQAVLNDYATYDLSDLMSAYNNSFEFLRNSSRSLQNSTTYLEPDLQNLFYEKKIRVYEKDSNGTDSLLSKVDNFQAMSLILYSMFTLVEFQKTENGSTFFFNTTARTVLDSSMNDLLVVTSDLIEKVEARLFEVLSDTKTIMTTLFICCFVLMASFIFISLALVMYNNKTTREFMEIFFTLSSSQARKINKNLLQFKDLIADPNNQEETFQRVIHHNTRTNASWNQPANRQHSLIHSKVHNSDISRVSLHKLYHRNFLILLVLIVCLAVTIGFTMIYYHQANTKLDVVNQQQVNLISALTYLNTISLFNAGLQSMFLLNNASTIENLPVTTYLLLESKKLVDVSKFQESLTSSDGSLNEYQREILYNVSCKYVYSDYDPWDYESAFLACKMISDGTNYVGLLKLFLQLHNIVDDLVEEFTKSNRTVSSIKEIYLTFYDFYYCYGDIANDMLLMSYTYSTNSYNDLVEDLEEKSRTLAWIAGVVCVVLGLFTWLFVIRRLSRVEFERKKMLALVPDKFLFSNFLMKKYLDVLKY